MSYVGRFRKLGSCQPVCQIATAAAGLASSAGDIAANRPLQPGNSGLVALGEKQCSFGRCRP